MRWENVYIFISSTFNDMHAERDYLVKKVFPTLSEWCEERKLRLIDIDLRWGVTVADSEAKNTVRACLRNIDECRPFFLCFLGQRRGWVPTPDDIGKDTYELFPKLSKDNLVGKASVTEMEIIHALVDPLHNGILRGTQDDSRSGQATEHAFFFLRDPDYIKDIPHPDLRAIYTNEAEIDQATADNELSRWREQEIPRTGRPVHLYNATWQLNESTPEIALPLCVPTTAPQDSPVWAAAFTGWKNRWAAAGIHVDDTGEISGTELSRAETYNRSYTTGRLGEFSVDGHTLADIVIEQLKNAIATQFPIHMTIEEPTPLQQELDQQAQLLRAASEGFIERVGDTEALSAYIASDDPRPFALTALAGMGKTSLLAHFIETFTPKENESLHYRFIGGSNNSVDASRLIGSLLEELRYNKLIESEIPANTSEMMSALPNLLAEAGTKGKVILVIDALNQLETGMSDLGWIPSYLPDNVKLIVSFKLGEETADAYYRQQIEHDHMVFHSVKPFDSNEDRQALVIAYLEQYFKELDPPRIEALIHSDGAHNPLFLKIALSELRVFGVHNDLSEVIRFRFGNSPVSAFNAVLARMESDPAYTKLSPAILLPHLFGLLSHSRYGLSVDELADLSVSLRLTDNRDYALDAIHSVLRQLRPFLARRDGRMDFFFESFKIAAKQRYTSDHTYARSSEEWHGALSEFFEAVPLTNRHKLMEQAWQHAYAHNGPALRALLWDYGFIKSKLNTCGIDALVQDYSLVELPSLNHTCEEATNLRFLGKALTLSTRTLREFPDQLPQQLFGRLSPSDSTEVAALLDQTASSQTTTWLRPTIPCFSTPHSRLQASCLINGYPVGIENNQLIFHTGRGSRNHGSIEFWDVGTLKRVRSFTVPSYGQGEHPGVALSSDFSLVAMVAVAGGDGGAGFYNVPVIRVFNLRSGQMIHDFKFNGSGLAVYRIAISLDNRKLAVTERYIKEGINNLWVFDLAEKGEKGEPAHAPLYEPLIMKISDKHVDYASLLTVSFSDDGHSITVAQSDAGRHADVRKGIIIDLDAWNRCEPELIKLPNKKTYLIGDGSVAIESDKDHGYHFVDCITGESLETLASEGVKATGTLFVRNNYAYSFTAKGSDWQMYVWDCSGPYQQISYRPENLAANAEQIDPEKARSLYSADGRTRIMRASDWVCVYDTLTGRRRYDIPIIRSERDVINMDLNAQGTLLLLCVLRVDPDVYGKDKSKGNNGCFTPISARVYVYELRPDKFKLLKTLILFQEDAYPSTSYLRYCPVKEVRFCRDSDRIIVVSKNGYAIWSVSAKKQLYSQPMIVEKHRFFDGLLILQMYTNDFSSIKSGKDNFEGLLLIDYETNCVLHRIENCGADEVFSVEGVIMTCNKTYHRGGDILFIWDVEHERLAGEFFAEREIGKPLINEREIKLGIGFETAPIFLRLENEIEPPTLKNPSPSLAAKCHTPSQQNLTSSGVSCPDSPPTNETHKQRFGGLFKRK